MQTLLELLKKFRTAHLMVVGDLMIDRFIWGDVERISPEAPVPVVRVLSESIRLGGAANVIHNIRTLGGKVTACGVVVADAAGKRMTQEIRRIGASTAGVFVDRRHETIQKTRVIAHPRHQQIVRLDRESLAAPIEGSLKRLRNFVLNGAARCDAIVISDYGKGVVHQELLQLIAQMAQREKLSASLTRKKKIIRTIDWRLWLPPTKMRQAKRRA